MDTKTKIYVAIISVLIFGLGFIAGYWLVPTLQDVIWSDQQARVLDVVNN